MRRNISALGFEHPVHGGSHAVPVALLLGELRPAFARELVIARAAVVFGWSPLAGDPALLLQATEGRKQRSRLDGECTTGDLADAVGYADTMQGLQLEGAEDQEI